MYALWPYVIRLNLVEQQDYKMEFVAVLFKVQDRVSTDPVPAMLIISKSKSENFDKSELQVTWYNT